ncbi:nuclear transport factor 2 family protein [Euzebya tangerina]|uniref:nuclear transport factor 2 family protein n=1 Tax=Euzebya tangerina TaxID=591198 RepID=UPI000E30D9CE|nr:hypothetical protein [Euzebya tangerina]
MDRRTVILGTATSVAGSATAALAWPPERRCDDPRERRNLRVMEEWVDNLVTGGDNSAFKSPDMTVTTPAALPYGGTIPDAEYGEALARYWGPPPTPPEGEPTLFADADRVFLQGTFAATGQPTGLAVEVPLVEVFTLARGLVTNDTLYFLDLDVILAALDA